MWQLFYSAYRESRIDLLLSKSIFCWQEPVWVVLPTGKTTEKQSLGRIDLLRGWGGVHRFFLLEILQRSQRQPTSCAASSWAHPFLTQRGSVPLEMCSASQGPILLPTGQIRPGFCTSFSLIKHPQSCRKSWHLNPLGDQPTFGKDSELKLSPKTFHRPFDRDAVEGIQVTGIWTRWSKFPANSESQYVHENSNYNGLEEALQETFPLALNLQRLYTVWSKSQWDE